MSSSAIRPANGSSSLAISTPAASFTDTVSPMPRKNRVTDFVVLPANSGTSEPVSTVTFSKPANCEYVRVAFFVNSCSASFQPALSYS